MEGYCLMCGMRRELVAGICEACADDHRAKVEADRKRQTLDSLNLRDVMEHGARMGTAMGEAFYNGAREALVHGSEYGWR